jgi:hypothetical protein
MTALPFAFSPPAAFRGTRDYVHSTDIYEAIDWGARAAGFPPNGDIDLRMHAKIVNRPEYRFSPDPRDAAAGAATARMVLGGAQWWVEIAETGEPVSRRKSYDESAIWDAAVLAGNAISLGSDVGSRPIETVTALAVVLHKTLLPPEPGKRWLLARLLLKRPLAVHDARDATITLTKQLGQVTRSVVAGSGGEFGEMTFILG